MQFFTSTLPKVNQVLFKSLKAPQARITANHFSSRVVDQLELKMVVVSLQRQAKASNQAGINFLLQAKPDLQKALSAFQEAKRLDQEAAQEAKEENGKNSLEYRYSLSHVARDLSNIASVYLKQKNYAQAENTLEEALALFNTAYPPGVVKQSVEDLLPVSRSLQKLAQVYINCVAEKVSLPVQPGRPFKTLFSFKDYK